MSALGGDPVEFVWMRRDGIDKPARIPVSAVQHWEGLDWHVTDPPVRPPRPSRRPKNVPARPVESTPVDAPEDKAADTKPAARTRKAPSGREED